MGNATRTCQSGRCTLDYRQTDPHTAMLAREHGAEVPLEAI